MGLYDAWKRLAFDAQGQAVKRVWDDYLSQEKAVYKEILASKLSKVEGTVAELGEQFNLSHAHVTAFVDGIHEAVDGLPPVDELEADTHIVLNIDFERLFKKMVEYKAKALYTLPEWNEIFSEEEQKEFYHLQKSSHTVIRSEKVGRNEPCPCGSGKKYKKCCVLS